MKTKKTMKTVDGMTYEIGKAEAKVVSSYRNIVDANILSEVDGKPVTAIWHNAFYNCICLASVIIPNTITNMT